jgi:hypothetical protein
MTLYGMQYVNSMINIEDLNAERVPDDHPSASAVVKSPLIFSAPFSAPWSATLGRTNLAGFDPATQPGDSVIAAFPGSSAAVWHTLGDAGVLNLAHQGGTREQSIEPYLIAKPVKDSSGVDPGDGFLSHALRLGGVGIIPRCNTAGQPIYELRMEDDSGDDDIDPAVRFQVNNISTPSAVNGGIVTLHVWYYTDAEEEFSFEFIGGELSFNPVLLGTVDRFWIRVQDGQIGDQWVFSLGNTDPAVSNTDFTTLQHSSTAYAVLDIPGVGNLDATSQERTSALTLLYSFFGAELKNGGASSAARCPISYTPTLAANGDYYAFLARQPSYANDYAVKHGGFVWWCPDSVQEYFYRDYPAARSRDLSTTSSLWVAFRRDSPDQEVRVDIVTGLEILTRSVTYDTQVSPVNHYFANVIAIAKTLDAVSENAVHTDFFRRLLGGVKKKLANPQTWQQIMKIGAGVLQKL